MAGILKTAKSHGAIVATLPHQIEMTPFPRRTAEACPVWTVRRETGSEYSALAAEPYAILRG